MEIKGKLVHLLDVQTGTSAKGEWSKQDFVIETEDAYPKKICINSFNNKVDLSTLKVGDTVNVSINIESREYNSKWYTNVSAWRIEKVEGGEATSVNNAPVDNAPAGELDDLPF